MTYEEFKNLAEHPQHRDVPAIFKLEVLETEELEDDYPLDTFCYYISEIPMGLLHYDRITKDFLKRMKKRWF